MHRFTLDLQMQPILFPKLFLSLEIIDINQSNYSFDWADGQSYKRTFYSFIMNKFVSIIVHREI